MWPDAACARFTRSFILALEDSGGSGRLPGIPPGLLHQVPEFRILRQRCVFLGGEIGAEEKILERMLAEDAMDHDAQRVALEIDAIIAQPITGQRAAIASEVSVLSLGPLQLLRQPPELAEDLELQFLGHPGEFTGAGGIEDDLKRSHHRVKVGEACRVPQGGLSERVPPAAGAVGPDTESEVLAGRAGRIPGWKSRRDPHTLYATRFIMNTPASGPTSTESNIIVVTGDLVWDTHVARLPVSGHGYFDPHGQTQLLNRYGGAWYLAEVIEAAICSHNKSAKNGASGKEETMAQTCRPPKRTAHEEIEGNNCPPGIAKGFSIWQWHDGEKKKAAIRLVPEGVGLKVKDAWPDGKAELGAWRVAEFLGCQEATWAPNAAGEIHGPQRQDATQHPAALVIDDLGLGFSQHEAAWPACLRGSVQPPAVIVAKASPPFDAPLWRKLLQPAWAERLTVVISAASLRDAGAEIAVGLSWDRTIEDLQREFGCGVRQAGATSPGGVGTVFRLCRRVVVICGRSGAAVFSRDPRSPEEAEAAGGRHPSELQFERFVFDPEHLEEAWSAQYPGKSFGTASVMTAALVCHYLREEHPSTHVAVGAGLAAARQLHRLGAGADVKRFEPGHGLVRPSVPRFPPSDFVKEELIFPDDPKAAPWTTFRSGYPRELLDEPVLFPPSHPQHPTRTLLTDVVGEGPKFLDVIAGEIVRNGSKRPLAGVPALRVGDYFTVDREEIENLNSVRAMIEEYTGPKNKDRRPLSIAVFGAPGSGKSFAIKQLAKTLFGEKNAALEFNLSQFRDLADLHEAFHEVRDTSVQGQVPLVFWDEFDSQRDGEELGWLKEFLAPMQDAEFVAKGKKHPFGRCLFVFAGGTKDRFEEFDLSSKKGDAGETNTSSTPKSGKAAREAAVRKEQDFKNAKGPDFISRLRGYVNIKGPNPASANDDVHIIRRGILLRSFIERYHPDLLQGEGKRVDIHSRVLAALLGASNYSHGSRSMEQIVSLSRLKGKRRFGPSELPPREVIQLHVSDDFAEIVHHPTPYRLTPDDVEELAVLIHSQWTAQKEKNQTGKAKDGRTNKQHSELSEADKEANRLPARLAILRLEACGYHVVPASPSARLGRQSVKVADLERDRASLAKLLKSEHRRWMREKLSKGMSYDGIRRDENERARLLLHHDLCRFDRLDEDETALDRAIILAIPEFLTQRNLMLVKVEPKPASRKAKK